ncbi:MAG: DEAD/DEAH box helicase [Epsilonproteobacteria bacterium]|nr:DEAD/DEAH box helicase [Campylobacterota bacterium]
MPFSSLHISPEINKAIHALGYHTPTAIQSKVIPLILQHQDIIARAQTGSGKTASFVLPLLQLWSQNIPEGKSKITTLVLTPTRELTLQVANAFIDYSTHLPKQPKVVSIIGGESIGDQLYTLQQGCDIVVATAGRFIDILSKKQINLSHLEFFILDEADKMLDLRFAEELEVILQALPTERQNLLFSATYPPKMVDIAAKITQDPTEVTFSQESPTVTRITQRAIEVNRENRGPLLRYLLSTENWEQVLVFMANKRAADNIAAKFRKHGFEAESFHGDLDQEDRIYTLDSFKAKKIRILFATDIAARGLDINAMACVVNFDLPRSPTDYIHRIGRTGRAGQTGLALSFIGHEDQDHFRLIEKRAKINIKREQIDGFILTGDPVPKVKGTPPIKGKRKSKKDKAREKAQKESR